MPLNLSEERAMFHAMRLITKIFGEDREFQKFHILLRSARRKVEKGLVEEGGKEFNECEKKFPEFSKLADILHMLYTEGRHDGMHMAGRRFKFKKDEGISW